MKPAATISLALMLSASSVAFAQSGEMKGMDMNNMEMMKSMNMDSKAQGTTKGTAVHKTTAVVKDIDAGKGKVILAHEPVKSLKWPAMTMGFSVKDKALFDKLAVGKKVNVEFTQQGTEYVVTAVK